MPSRPEINGANECALCGNALSVKGPAQAGGFPGHYYLHVSQPTYWR